MLNEFSDCFAEKSGFCPYIEHKIVVSPEFKPKRLREYRMPEVMKPEIQRKIDELLTAGFIRPSIMKAEVAFNIRYLLLGQRNSRSGDSNTLF